MKLLESVKVVLGFRLDLHGFMPFMRFMVNALL
jgi:hypothetical protein